MPDIVSPLDNLHHALVELNRAVDALLEHEKVHGVDGVRPSFDFVEGPALKAWEEAADEAKKKAEEETQKQGRDTRTRFKSITAMLPDATEVHPPTASPFVQEQRRALSRSVVDKLAQVQDCVEAAMACGLQPTEQAAIERLHVFLEMAEMPDDAKAKRQHNAFIAPKLRYLEEGREIPEGLELLRSSIEATRPKPNPELDGGNQSEAKNSKLPDGFYSPTDIAQAMKVPDKADAIRKALARLFAENRLADGAWMENNNPAKGQAKIMYKLSAVLPFLSRYEPSAKG